MGRFTPWPLVWQVLGLGVASAQHMNQDVAYLVANARPGHEEEARGFFGEWFEVYSPPIRSRYSEVVWRVLPSVPLPASIVSRYNGSTAMAVTGYEVDVVRRTEQGERSVPCTESYNHHYTNVLVSSAARVLEPAAGSHLGHSPPAIAALALDEATGLPLTQAFNEHNGNEHRQSYHGYPEGYVQPIYRPASMVFNPMQINTRNPDGSGQVGGPLPRSSQAPANASYSGLLECPCTTRTKKVPPSGGRPGTIDGRPYEAECKGALLAQRNPTCEVATYLGGMACCTDGTVLLDADQEVPPAVDEVFFKWRFYFEDYNPSIHRPVVHIEWSLNDCDSGGSPGNPKNCKHIEYDVPRAPSSVAPGEAVHEVTSTWQVRDMLHPCDSRTEPYCADPRLAGKDGLSLVMAGGHCHAPACISLELFDADTGELLCSIRPRFGKTHKAKDEESYLWLPPCQWGRAEEGLMPPPLLHLDTNLTSIKRENSTYAHPGVMAIWQMRAIYAGGGMPLYRGRRYFGGSDVLV
mmetsp:Transcript_129827/g.277119  ORF Transcript_129827/g.277119 Transcript_129827/m.277119 type:complete len:521 (-) Transcript_129827:100-1662(-)